MKGQLFKTSLFGLNKKSVYTYLSALNQKLEEELETKNAQIASLREQISGGAAVSGNASNADEIVEMAKKQADEIIAKAHNSLLMKKEDIKEEIKKEKMKLKILQAEVEGLKKKAVEATAKFTIDIEDLIES